MMDKNRHRRRESHQFKDWMRTVHSMQPYRNRRALWLALASALIMTTVMVSGATSPKSHELYPHFHVEYVLVTNILIFIVLYIYNFWIIRINMKKANHTFFVGLAGSLVIAVFFSILAYGIEVSIYGPGNTSNKYVLGLIIFLTASLIAFLISQLLHNVTRHQQTIVENEHLQAENMIIRYESLERQISPHFLFNSLNTLDGLIGIDDDTAHKYLQQLASTFRYIMQKKKEVTLADELEFTHAYIYMMQMRYGDTLTIEEHIDPAMLQRQVVPISLQLLIENAIKHNVISQRHPLNIVIETTPDQRLRVQNHMQPKADCETSNGIGLANLSQRYQLLFHVEITITEDNNLFTVEIPLI